MIIGMFYLFGIRMLYCIYDCLGEGIRIIWFGEVNKVFGDFLEFR